MHVSCYNVILEDYIIKGFVMELVLNRQGYLVGETHRECVVCSEIYEITSKTVTRCKKCNCERVKSTSPESRMLARARSRANENNMDFDIGIDDIIIPETCPILGIPLEVHRGTSGGKPASPSLDRVDNSKGYVKGNVIVLSHLANMMKSSASVENLLKFAEWVFGTYSSPRQASSAAC